MVSDDKPEPQAVSLPVDEDQSTIVVPNTEDKVENDALSQSEHEELSQPQHDALSQSQEDPMPERPEASIPKWRLISLYIRYAQSSSKRSFKLTMLVPVSV
jgi:hypothetical protein